EHELARIHGRGRTGVDGASVGTAPGDDLVERAGGGDARVVSDSSLQVGARGDGHGDGHPAGRRPAVLAVVEGDVTRVVQEGQRSGRPRPGAVHVVRYLDLLGGVVLGHPRDQEIPLRHRAGERDVDRRDLPGRECHPLDEGDGRRPCRGRRRGGRGRRRGGRGRRRGGGPGGGRRGGRGRRRHLEREGARRAAVAVDDDEVGRPGRYVGGELRGADEARAVRAGVVITAARDLRPGTGRATDIEDRVEARAGAARLDRRRARDRRGPLEDPLGRGTRVAAAARLRTRAARRAAEGPPLGGDRGRVV